MIRGVVTVANFIDVFDGVVTMASGAADLTGDLLLLLLLLLPPLAEVGELITSFSGGTTPSPLRSTGSAFELLVGEDTVGGA